MKTLIVITILSLISSCGIHDQGARKRGSLKNKSTKVALVKSGIVESNQDCTIVEPEWIVKYYNLEKRHESSVPEDSQIEKVGNNFKITQEVANHYMDMRKKE